MLHVREDWRIHAEEGGIITSLPVLFENMVVEVLLTLKEIVIEVDSETIDTINKELLYNTVQHFHGLLEVHGYYTCMCLMIWTGEMISAPLS